MTMKLMMATKAFHPGSKTDVSTEDPDLCVVRSEDGDDYVGQWVCGLGLIDVRFPKATTRPCTEIEREYWKRKVFRASWGPDGWKYVDEDFAAEGLFDGGIK